MVFASRPGVVARALGIPVVPDLDGWSSYVSAGHFAGDSSPYAGVRLMDPGARLSATRRPGGGWDVTQRQGFSVDDLMRRAVAAQAECSFDDLLELAGAGLGTAATSLAALYDGPLRLALSGGKDSRVIAAATVGAGLVPAFNTNIDTRAEGETARRLTGILREKLGVEIEHRLAASSPVGRVTATDLTDRVRRLQAEYDYQYPSTYSIRPARSGRLAEQVSVALSGAGGELAVGNWYPPEFDGDCSRATADELIRRKLLLTATPLGATHPDVRERERARLLTVTDRAEAAGLTGLKLCDYAYLHGTHAALGDPRLRRQQVHVPGTRLRGGRVRAGPAAQAPADAAPRADPAVRAGVGRRPVRQHQHGPLHGHPDLGRHRPRLRARAARHRAR